MNAHRSALDTSIHFPTESSSIGYLLKHKGIQKDNKNNVVLNKKKDGSYTDRLEKAKVSYASIDVDDELLDLSARNVLSAKDTVQKSLNAMAKDERQIGKNYTAVRFAVDPNTNDVVVHDINKELNNNNSFNGSCSMWNESFNGLYASYNGGSMCLDLSFPNFANNSTCGIDFAEVLEEKIEKLPKIFSKIEKLPKNFSNANHQYGSKNNSIFLQFERGDCQLDTTRKTSEDDHEKTVNSETQKSNRKKRQKLQQFYNRKEYRSAFRTSKIAADKFILHNAELIHEFYEFYISSLSSTSTNSDENVKQKDTQTEDFLKRWCESDGRGLEHAILISYVLSNNCPTNDDMDNAIFGKKINNNDARRYEQIPNLPSSMAHQFALMDAIIV